MLLLIGAKEFCDGTAGIWGVVGYVVLILKIVIPLALIVLGMIDLGKAVISSDEKEINNAVNRLLRRFIAAVVVFFIPTIVSALFNALLGFDFTSDNVNKCVQCVTNVSSMGTQCQSKVSIDSGFETTNTNTNTNTNAVGQ